VAAGDGAGLLALLAQIRTRAERSQRSGGKVIVVQEAGLDGFWVHRLLEGQGLESHVVDFRRRFQWHPLCFRAFPT
jgi:transposase